MSDDHIKRSDTIDVLEKLSACKETGEEIGTEEETYIGKYEAITEISDLPSADRPQGEWIDIDTCPNCGVRMKGIKNNKECHKPESLYYRAFCEERKNSAYCDGCEFWH